MEFRLESDSGSNSFVIRVTKQDRKVRWIEWQWMSSIVCSSLSDCCADCHLSALLFNKIIIRSVCKIILHDCFLYRNKTHRRAEGGTAQIIRFIRRLLIRSLIPNEWKINTWSADFRLRQWKYWNIYYIRSDVENRNYRGGDGQVSKRNVCWYDGTDGGKIINK